MNKQVLVIPEDKEAEFWGDTEDMLSVDLYKKYSPGNLLVEVKGRVLETEIEDYRAGRVKMLTIHSSNLILENPEKRETTILILGVKK